MAIGHEWSSVGLFFSSFWNAWGLLASGGVLAGLLLWFETMVLRREASRLAYTMIFVLCIVSACFVTWQEQYLLTRDYEKRLHASDTEKARLATQVDKLSKLVEEQEKGLNAKSTALASLKAQYQTARYSLGTLKEKQRASSARARLAILRAEGLRLSQNMIANPSGPTPDWELGVWTDATEKTLEYLFHHEQIQEFHDAENVVFTYAKKYADDYHSRHSGVFLKEETQEIVNRLSVLLINVQVATLEKFSRNLKTISLKN